MIVNVHYIDEKTDTIRSSGTYSYRCSIPNASVGMEVIAPTAKRTLTFTFSLMLFPPIKAPDLYSRRSRCEASGTPHPYSSAGVENPECIPFSRRSAFHRAK